MATAGKRKIPLPEKRCRITSPREKRKKRKTNKKMEGHCKERHVVEEAEGGRPEDRNKGRRIVPARPTTWGIMATGDEDVLFNIMLCIMVYR